MNGEWRGFRLIPDDVLFFRDGRPSSIGADHYLRSIFPPYPSTLYGALRTRRLVDAGVALSGLDGNSWERLPSELRGELGEWGGFGTLRVRGPWICGANGLLLPCPADIGLVTQRPAQQGTAPKVKSVVRYRPVAAEGGGHSHPLAPMRPFEWRNGAWQVRDTTGEAPRPSTEWFIDSAGLAPWAAGGVPAAEHLVHRSELWVDEVRTGLGMQKSRRQGEDGMLYTFGFIRMRQRISLGFDMRGMALAPGGRLRLGGEARTAQLASGDLLPAASLDEAGPESRWLALCLASPLLCREGAYPAGTSATGGRAIELGGAPLELVGAIVAGYSAIGGWDMTRNQPKPMRRALAPGSVFFFSHPDGAAGVRAAAASLHGTHLSDDFNEGLDTQGFGLVLAGGLA